MKTQKILLFIVLILFSTSLFSQGIVNDGAVIVIESGTVVSVTDGGGYYNQTNGTSGSHGQIDLAGTLEISGDFENNVTDADEHVFLTPGSDGYVIFNGSSDQTISNNIANAYIDFENLSIDNTPNTVFVEAGSAVTVNGNLTVTSGTFRLASPLNGEGPTASLITNTSGTISGFGSLYVDRHFETAGRYVYFSVPVDNATDDLFDNTALPNNFNPNLYSYDETYEAPEDPTNTNYSNWSDPTYAFYNAWTQVANESLSVPLSNNAVGYVTFNETELDIEFGGSLLSASLNNAASYSPGVTYTLNDDEGIPSAGDYYDGWNLVGNPYPCALNWDDPNWVKTNISNTVYMWDDDLGNYVYYNNNDGSETLGVGQSVNELSGADANYIPAMQAFYVKATAPSPVLTIHDDVREHHQMDMYKKDTEPEYTFEYLKFRTEYNDFFDEMIIRFLNDATTEVDPDFDAYKMFPWSTPAMIYSFAQNPETPVAINSLPVTKVGTSIPIGFLTNEAGKFTISTEEFHFNLTTDVKFIDKLLDKEFFVNEDFEYSFEFSGGESRDRFYLFVAPTGVNNEEDNHFVEANSKVWSSQNKIYVTFNSLDLLDSKIEVFDVLGRPIIQKRLTGNYNVINVPGASGTYFVKLVTKDGNSRTDKVFIQK